MSPAFSCVFVDNPRHETPAMTGPITPRRRLRRWLLRLTLLPVLAAAGLWAYVAWQHYRASVTLAEAVAEADRLDPGWRLDDLLARRAAVPDERNAALRVLAITARLPANYPNPDLDKALGDPT